VLNATAEPGDVQWFAKLEKSEWSFLSIEELSAKVREVLKTTVQSSHPATLATLTLSSTSRR